jgi:hypothetical protein
MRTFRLAAAAAAAVASGQYNGPFTMLSANGLANTADPGAGFGTWRLGVTVSRTAEIAQQPLVRALILSATFAGPEDHLLMCKGSYVFVDIDQTAMTYSSPNGGDPWVQTNIT